VNPIYIKPDWPAPTHVKSLITTRFGGFSAPPYDSFNLANHVGDRPANVIANRQQLCAEIGHSVRWLSQVHGTEVIDLSNAFRVSPQVDGATTSCFGQVCAVLTADCLPLLMCDRTGSKVAAIHAGWKGLAAGIIGAACREFDASVQQLLVYLGPAISQQRFEVGGDVIEAFEQAEIERRFVEPVTRAFRSIEGKPGKYCADLYRLARSELQGLGVQSIYGGNFCTYAEERFYSYRRQGVTGRMASLIWLDK